MKENPATLSPTADQCCVKLQIQSDRIFFSLKRFRLNRSQRVGQTLIPDVKTETEELAFQC